MFGFSRAQSITFVVMVVLIAVSPFVLYPVFLMRVLTAALFACAFNLMLGYVGLLSFGHAAFFGMGSYVAAWTMKVWHVDASIAIIFGGLTGAGSGAGLSGDPPVRHLLRHDHLGAGADGLLLLPGGDVHRW
jgi:branched-chain amino acid transport system permease protein